MESFDTQYGRIVEEIIHNGTKTPDRTGTGVRKIFGADMRFDLGKQFPAPTQKKLFFDSAVGEMLWIYQDQSNDVQLLRDKYGIEIWDEWEMEDGTIGNAYGYIVRKHKQIDKLIHGLKRNPYSRRHVMSLWDIEELPYMSLEPCAFQTIWTVTDGKLNCQLIQRSGDMGLGVPFNTAQYAVLTHLIAYEVGLEPGVLWHTITDAHVYENHVEPLMEMLSRTPIKGSKPTLEINRWHTDYQRPKTFYEYTLDDIKLEGYKSHPHIKMDVSV